MSSTKGDIVQLAQQLFSDAYQRFAGRDPAKIAALTDELTRLEREATAAPEFTACFVGNAGVGKSTLINAIVDPRARLLPEGGAGPLTARETRIVGAPSEHLQADYIDPAELQHWLDELDPDLATDARESFGRRSETRHLLQLLVTGTAHPLDPDEYLIDAALTALGRRPRFGSQLRDADCARVGLAGSSLKAAKHQYRDGRGLAAFLSDVRAHTSGSLAPVVKALTVGCSSNALIPGLTLVDLPGLGIANDAYQVTTRQYLAERARLTVIAVDRSGLVDAVALPLQQAGVFTRLLHGLNEPKPYFGPLAVVVLKLDLTASEDWRRDRATSGLEARPWVVHLRQANVQARHLLKAQLRLQLEEAASRSARTIRGDDALIEKVLASIHVIPVQPTEFQKLAIGDPENVARVHDAADTGIPEFVAKLHATCAESGGLDQEQFLARVLAFQASVSSLLTAPKS